MVREIALRFLGTSSQTSITRNYSSLLVKLDHQTAMVDCGESTQRQLLNRFVGGEEKLSSIRHIFITHLHADHVLGLVPLLCTMMGPGSAAPGDAASGNGVGGSAGGESSKADKSTARRPRVEIYGPSGLRALIRTTLTLCYTTLTGYYTVHELLWPTQMAYAHEALIAPEAGVVSASIPESTSPLLGALNGAQRTIPHLPPLDSELPGMDFRLDEQTASWPCVASIGSVQVSAAPILHRCPTVGYVFEEPDSASQSVTPEMIHALESNAAALEAQQGIKHPKRLLGKLTRDRKTVHLPDGTMLHPPALDVRGRKIVVLGDTYDASAGLDNREKTSVALDATSNTARGMLALAHGADVLVHECTNAALPSSLLPGNARIDERRDEVRAKALMRGHATPQVAGQFAARCAARQLLLNHFSIRYPAPHPTFKMTQDEATLDEMIASSSSNGKPRIMAERKALTMREIEKQATEAWHAGVQGIPASDAGLIRRRKAIAAFDGFTYHVSSQSENHSDATLSSHDSDLSRAGLQSSSSSSTDYKNSDRGSASGHVHFDDNGKPTFSSRMQRPGRGRPNRPHG